MLFHDREYDPNKPLNESKQDITPVHLKWGWDTDKKLHYQMINDGKEALKDYGIKLPSKIIRLIAAHNGATVNPCNFDTQNYKKCVLQYLLSLDTMSMISIINIFKNFDESNPFEELGIYPFAMAKIGDYEDAVLCADQKGKIILYTKYNTDIEPVANSIDEFLNNIYQA